MRSGLVHFSPRERCQRRWSCPREEQGEGHCVSFGVEQGFSERRFRWKMFFDRKCDGQLRKKSLSNKETKPTMLLSSSSTRVALAAAAFSSAASSSTRASYSSRCRLASCRPAGRATTAATAATRRSVGAGLVAIGVGAATAGFPRGAAAKASRPDVENVRRTCRRSCHFMLARSGIRARKGGRASGVKPLSVFVRS